MNLAAQSDQQLLAIAGINYANATDIESGQALDREYSNNQLLRSIALTNFVIARRLSGAPSTLKQRMQERGR
jgi:hypothetical protein